MAEFTLWGIGGAVLTGVLLEALKRIWLDAAGEPVIRDRWAVLAALGVGTVLSVAAYVGAQVPGVGTWLDVVGAGVMAGLSACGLYSVAKTRE